jgi:hypothetical protein
VPAGEVYSTTGVRFVMKVLSVLWIMEIIRIEGFYESKKVLREGQ